LIVAEFGGKCAGVKNQKNRGKKIEEKIRKGFRRGGEEPIGTGALDTIREPLRGRRKEERAKQPKEEEDKEREQQKKKKSLD